MNKTITINGINLPVTSFEKDTRLFLCKDSKNFHSYNYANKKQAYSKITELAMNGISAHVSNPSMFARGFKIIIVEGK